MNPTSASRSRAIGLLCIFSHVLAIGSFGAVFWIDASDYGNLAIALARHGGLTDFYDGAGTWTFSHLQPGLPLVGVALSLLPTELQWPVLAIVQHALAGVATYVFFTTLDRYWPSLWNVAGAALLSFLPFYQASHSSFMTESLTSSLVLLGVAQSIRLAKERVFETRRLALLLLFTVLATQLRSYAGVVLAGAALPALYRHRLLFSRYSAGCAFAVAVAGLAYPSYRFVQTGGFWPPSAGLNSLIAGWWVNPEPDDAVLEALSAYPAPPELQPARLVRKGLSYDNALVLGRYWKALGWDDRRIARTGQEMGALLRGQGGMVQANRLTLAAVSSGSVWAYCAWPESRLVFPGYTAAQLCSHHQRSYEFQSWIDPGNKMVVFRRFFLSPPGAESHAFHQESKEKLAAAIRPHLAELFPGWQDPLLLGRVPPDVIVALALISLLLLVFSEPALAFIGAWLVATNFAVAFSFPVGNSRYAYLLIPVYVGLCSVAAARSWPLLGRNRKSA